MPNPYETWGKYSWDNHFPQVSLELGKIVDFLLVQNRLSYKTTTLMGLHQARCFKMWIEWIIFVCMFIFWELEKKEKFSGMRHCPSLSEKLITITPVKLPFWLNDSKILTLQGKKVFITWVELLADSDFDRRSNILVIVIHAKF